MAEPSELHVLSSVGVSGAGGRPAQGSGNGLVSRGQQLLRTHRRQLLVGAAERGLERELLIAAWLSWRLARAHGDRGGQILAAILAAIGVGSFLFHTVAQVRAMLADVLPIQIFILVYLGLATVHFFALPWWAGVAAAAAFLPASALAAAGLGALFGPLNGSTGVAGCRS